MQKGNSMQYTRAMVEDLEQIFALVQKTIKTVYPKYYLAEVVDFFCMLHSYDCIRKDIENDRVGVLFLNGKLVGTGSHNENHITRVYVDPDFQGQGYGSFIMQHLEDEIFAGYDTVLLDASLPASHLYKKRGYQTVKHERLSFDGGAVLVYEIMEKKQFV